jgi:hypothetical protein
MNIQKKISMPESGLPSFQEAMLAKGALPTYGQHTAAKPGVVGKAAGHNTGFPPSFDEWAAEQAMLKPIVGGRDDARKAGTSYDLAAAQRSAQAAYKFDPPTTIPVVRSKPGPQLSSILKTGDASSPKGNVSFSPDTQ